MNAWPHLRESERHLCRAKLRINSRVSCKCQKCYGLLHFYADLFLLLKLLVQKIASELPGKSVQEIPVALYFDT